MVPCTTTLPWTSTAVLATEMAWTWRPNAASWSFITLRVGAEGWVRGLLWAAPDKAACVRCSSVPSYAVPRGGLRWTLCRPVLENYPANPHDRWRHGVWRREPHPRWPLPPLAPGPWPCSARCKKPRKGFRYPVTHIKNSIYCLLAHTPQATPTAGTGGEAQFAKRTPLTYLTPVQICNRSV